MPSNWTMFWTYPVIYLSGLLVRAWSGRLQAAETEWVLFSIGWILVFLTSIGLDRWFGRVSTVETERERKVIRRFIRGEGASPRPGNGRAPDERTEM